MFAYILQFCQLYSLDQFEFDLLDLKIEGVLEDIDSLLLLMHVELAHLLDPFYINHICYIEYILYLVYHENVDKNENKILNLKISNQNIFNKHRQAYLCQYLFDRHNTLYNHIYIQSYYNHLISEMIKSNWGTKNSY